MCHAKMPELIEVLFGGWLRWDHVLDGGHDPTVEGIIQFLIMLCVKRHYMSLDMFSMADVAHMIETLCTA